jgi:aminomethyltransferase
VNLSGKATGGFFNLATPRWQEGTSALSAKTPLHDWHIAHGGKLVEFAGWWLPVSYGEGLIAEHLNTRKNGGLFDISHMGRFMISGNGALPFLESILTNWAGKLLPGRAQYTLISDPDGRPIDDAYLYRTEEDRFMLVVNASNREKAWQWLNRHNKADAKLIDASQDLAMLAVQGPRSEELLSALVDAPLPSPGRNNGEWNKLAGVGLFVARTGYTGEPLGFELFPPWEQALPIWEKLVEVGAELGLGPVGLGARDTLRLEAGLPLYGHEYTPDRPIMTVSTARLGVDLSPGRGEFIGREALAAQAAELHQRIYLVVALTRGMMREGSPVLMNGEQIGELTSATTIPAWRFDGEHPGQEHYIRPLGLALLQGSTLVREEVEIIYRNKTLPGRVVDAFVRPQGRYLKPIEFEGGAV